MIDIWQEIFSTIRKNKLRTFLTGFAVSWGIFMLIILLGAGNGLKNGVMANFSSDAKNTIYMWAGRTEVAFKGLQKGRIIRMENDDVSYLKSKYPTISNITPIINRGGTIISHGKEYGSWGLKGVDPENQNIENIRFENHKGRFINYSDIKDFRKVIVIHQKIADVLFKNNPDPIGKYVVADKIPYLVIGVYNTDNMHQNPDSYIPVSTARKIYNPKNGISQIQFTIEGYETQALNDELDTDIRKNMAAKYTFDPTDKRALGMWNSMNRYLQTISIFNGISMFVWVIGIGTLIAGIVGVSNIMLITVKERTKEFGIRKSIGATPFSIIKLVLLESLLITSFFGYIGMVAGVGLTELINFFIMQSAGVGSENGVMSMTIFKDPTVDLSVVFSSTSVLIISGLLAGYFPARKAVRVKPIEALKYE